MYGVETGSSPPAARVQREAPQSAVRADRRRRGLVKKEQLGVWISAHDSASFCFIPPERLRASRRGRDPSD